ncbi:TRZ/ATZ family hydrolase [Endozoicomonadaceae bacterium StTr2]
MSEIDTLIHARWIIPVNSSRDILEHHSLAVHDGRILAILPRAEAEQQYQPKQIKDLQGHALIPGFVNTHGHAAMSLMRGKADDLELMDWLNNHIWPTEAKWVNEQFVHDGTRLAIAEMLRSGTTTFSDNYFFPDVSAATAHEAGIRCQIAFPVIDFANRWAKDAEQHLHKGLEVNDQFRNQPLVNVAFGPHSPYAVSEEALRQVAVLSDQLDLPVQMHICETADEVSQIRERTGKRPVHYLEELGLLTPRLQCVHMTQLNDDDIRRIAEYGCHILHCPESNLKLGSGFCEVTRLKKEGINVALGTDGCASNNDLDMLGEMRTAALLAKVVGKDMSSMGAYEALECATLNGAKALGLDATTGSLEVGKSADITAIDLDVLECAPLYNPASQIVYASTRNQVSHVWVEGQLLLDDRNLTRMHESELIESARDWHHKITSEA